MTSKTYHIVIPFLEEEGVVVALEAIQCNSADQAAQRVDEMSKLSGVVGALAFSRSGDIKTGVFDDAVILKTCGDVPLDVDNLS